MRKFISNNFWGFVFCIIFFVAGLILGRIIRDFPYLKLDTKVGIGDIANFVIALVVAVLIPISLSPIIKNKRVIKDFLIYEVKDSVDFLSQIKTTIDALVFTNSTGEADRVKVNSMIAKDLGMKIGSLADQLDTSFKTKCQKLKIELNERYTEYWGEMTGGELMSTTFQFNLAFRTVHDRNYARLQASLKKAIHEINNL